MAIRRRNHRVPRPSRAVLYSRVSTGRQATGGVSLGEQEARLQAFAVSAQLEVVEHVTDRGVSASVPFAKRPGGARVLALLKDEQADVLVVAKLDRAFRNLRDCLAVVDELNRRGVALILLDMGGELVDTRSATGQLFLQMVGAFAEFERRRVSERVQATHVVVRGRGRCVGTVPFGFRRSADGHVEPDPEEAATLARVMALRACGEPYARVAAVLNAEGRLTRSGRPWTLHGVYAVVTNDARRASDRGLQLACEVPASA